MRKCIEYIISAHKKTRMVMHFKMLLFVNI